MGGREKDDDVEGNKNGVVDDNDNAGGGNVCNGDDKNYDRDLIKDDAAGYADGCGGGGNHGGNGVGDDVWNVPGTYSKLHFERIEHVELVEHGGIVARINLHFVDHTLA